MAITLTDEMMEILQGLEKGEARMFLKGIQMAQGLGGRGGVGAVPKPDHFPASQSPAPAQSPQPPPQQPAKPYRANRGAQSEILRALFTGVASYTQLQEVLRYNREVITTAINRLHRQGDVTELTIANGGTAWQLTPKGRHLAALYVANPGMKILNVHHKQKLAPAGQTK